MGSATAIPHQADGRVAIDVPENALHADYYRRTDGGNFA
jgi:hypothetical protein